MSTEGSLTTAPEVSTTPGSADAAPGSDVAAVTAAVQAEMDAAVAAEASEPTGVPVEGTELAKAEEKTSEPTKEAPQESALVRQLKKQRRAAQAREAEQGRKQAEYEASFSRRVQEAVAQQMATFKTDPIEQLKALGLSDTDIANRLLHGNKKTPEEMAHEALEENKRLRNEIAQSAQATARRNAETEILGYLKDDAAYPNTLVEYTPEEALKEVHAIAFKARERGVDLSRITTKDFADALEQQAGKLAARRERIKAERTKKAPASQGATKAARTESPAQGKKSSGQTATPTLGTSLGSERSSVVSVDKLTLSKEEQDALVLRALEKELQMTSASN